MSEPFRIDPTLLELVRCPKSLAELRVAEGPEIALVNDAISHGKCFDADGELVASEVQSGLVTVDGHWFYPVQDQIPTLIPGEAIELETLRG